MQSINLSYITGDVLGRVPSCQHTGTACGFGKVTTHVQPRDETSWDFPSWGPRENQWDARARPHWLGRDNFPYLFPTPCSTMAHWEIEIGHGTISSAENEGTPQMMAFGFPCLFGSGLTSTLLEASNAKQRTRLVRLP